MGFLRRIFRNGLRSNANVPMTTAVAQAIVADYEDAMASMPTTVMDESRLPHAKAQIKEALLLMRSTTKDQKLRDQLNAGYISLADWQEGIGDSARSFQMTPQDLADPLAAAKRIA